MRELLQIREQLVPMLKEAFDRYHTTGILPVRALVAIKRLKRWEEILLF